MHLQIGHLGTEIDCSASDAASARDAFDRVHCLRLPRFVAPRLLEAVQANLSAAASSFVKYDGVGTETRLEFGKSAAALDLAMNDQRLFETLQALTGLGPIGYFGGRVYTMRAGAGGFGWHSDNEGHRLIGFSVCLGAESFAGGQLQIADAETETPVCEIANTVAGDAVIFRISPDVVHRVLPVEGSVPKVAYSGWFRSEPTYQEFLRRRWRGDEAS